MHGRVDLDIDIVTSLLLVVMRVVVVVSEMMGWGVEESGDEEEIGRTDVVLWDCARRKEEEARD